MSQYHPEHPSHTLKDAKSQNTSYKKICKHCGVTDSWQDRDKIKKPCIENLDKAIVRKRQAVERKMKKLCEDLSQLQESCPHKNADYVPRGSSGNYDPSNDSYWYDITCLDCGKRWVEDQ